MTKYKLSESTMFLKESELLQEAWSLYNEPWMINVQRRNVHDPKKLTKAVYIVLTDTKTGVGKVIKHFTQSKYDHASLALDHTMKHAYSFGENTDDKDQGFVHEKFHAGMYRDNNAHFVQLKLPVTEEEYKKIKDGVEEFKKIKKRDGHIPFNVPGIVLTGLNIPVQQGNSFFCSQFIAHILAGAGIHLFNKAHGLVRPHDFLAHPDLKKVDHGSMRNRIKRENEKPEEVKMQIDFSPAKARKEKK
jgi:hypothetical protein